MTRNTGGRWLILALTFLSLGAARPLQAACTGDCGGDGEVTVDEILVGVNVALGLTPTSACTAMDSDGNGQVTVDELVTALNGALAGCLDIPTPAATPTATATQSIPTPLPCSDSDGVASVTASNASPSSGNGALSASCVTVENAGGTRTELTRVAVRGTVNGVAFLLQIYFVTATGEIDTVSYGWQPDPVIPDFFAALAFCNAPGCGGASVNLASKLVVLNNVSLGGDAGGSAVLNGNIALDSIPGPVATPTPAGCPGGSATLAFTDVQATNSAMPIPATLVFGAAMNFSTPAAPPTSAIFSASYEACPQVFPRFTLSFRYAVEALQAGAAGILDQIEFREERFNGFRSWKAQSGTLVIEAVDAAGTHYRLVDARMRSNDFDTKGTFTLNVSGTLAP